MSVRSLLTLTGVAITFVVFGAVAPGHDWAVSTGVLLAVIASFLLAIRTDDPDRTIQEIFESEAQMRRLRRTS